MWTSADVLHDQMNRGIYDVMASFRRRRMQHGSRRVWRRRMHQHRRQLRLHLPTRLHLQHRWLQMCGWVTHKQFRRFFLWQLCTSSPPGSLRAPHLAGNLPPSFAASCEWSSGESSGLWSPCAGKQTYTHYLSLTALICSNVSIPVTHSHTVINWHVESDSGVLTETVWTRMSKNAKGQLIFIFL